MSSKYFILHIRFHNTHQINYLKISLLILKANVINKPHVFLENSLFLKNTGLSTYKFLKDSLKIFYRGD